MSVHKLYIFALSNVESVVIHVLWSHIIVQKQSKSLPTPDEIWSIKSSLSLFS